MIQRLCCATCRIFSADGGFAEREDGSTWWCLRGYHRPPRQSLSLISLNLPRWGTSSGKSAKAGSPLPLKLGTGVYKVKLD